MIMFNTISFTSSYESCEISFQVQAQNPAGLFEIGQPRMIWLAVQDQGWPLRIRLAAEIVQKPGCEGCRRTLAGEQWPVTQGMSWVVYRDMICTPILDKIYALAGKESILKFLGQ